MPRYVLGFLALANRLGRNLVGQPVEDEHHELATGNTLQTTSKGLLVWRKVDNWTAYTDGYKTWLWGPDGGIHSRLNSQRYAWERDGYRPTLYRNPSPSGQGRFLLTPRGCILHGSRSGRPRDFYTEFHGLRAYAQSGANGLAWHASIGEDAVAEHLDPREWGWHVRSWSREWLGVEFAQPTLDADITERQARAFAWWWLHVALEAWPRMPPVFLTHAETEPGRADGKSDCYPIGDPRLERLMILIMDALGAA